MKAWIQFPRRNSTRVKSTRRSTGRPNLMLGWHTSDIIRMTAGANLAPIAFLPLLSDIAATPGKKQAKIS